MGKTRFTDTGKWRDPWFNRLGPYSKLMFLFLCENCDPAGFWEIAIDRAAFETGIPEEYVEAALKELSRAYELNDGWIWIRKFIQHQKNLPLNPSNQSHKGILRCIERRKHLFPNVLDKVREMELQGAIEGLTSPIGIGIGIGKGKEEIHKRRKADPKPTPEFDRFWDVYPKPDEKRRSWAMYQKEIATPEDAEDVIKAAVNYAAKVKRENTKYTYIKYAFSWLRDGFWRDYLDVAPKKVHKNSPEVEAMLARARAARVGTGGSGSGSGGSSPADAGGTGSPS